MNDFKLKITFFDTETSEISGYTLPPITNNISGSAISSNTNSGKKVFVLGASNVDDGVNLTNANTYPGIVFDGVSDSEGNCNASFTINGAELNAFAMYFDETEGQYAKHITINGNTYLNDKNRFCVVGLNGATEVSVNISKWSHPKFPVRITAIVLSLTEEFGKEYIKSLERNSVLVDDPKTPSYGISAQSGKLVMQDRNNVLLDLARAKVLKDGLEFELILNGRTIGKYISDNLTYTSTDDVAEIDLIDDIVDLQNEIFEGIDFPTVPSEVVPLTALEILTAYYPKVFVMDAETRNRLSSIVVAFPQMDKKDAYKSLIDFCRATSTRVYKTEEGTLTIKYYE